MSALRPHLHPGAAAAFLALCALVISFFIFLMLAMGECLPRNGSVAMHACDAGKRFEFLAFPLATLASVLAGVGALRTRPRTALTVIGAAPFLALVVVLLVERSAF